MPAARLRLGRRAYDEKMTGITSPEHELAAVNTDTDVCVLSGATWRAREAEHARRADAATAQWRARRRSHEPDPTEDFLYTYYPTKPSLLRRWHPGAAVVLEDAAHEPRASWTWYRCDADGSVRVNVGAYLAERGATVDFVAEFFQRTLAARPALGCWGMHEWAMVYRQAPGTHRHPIPLRLGEAATDRVVEATPLMCTHFDAFRFFTPGARPLNARQLTREGQPAADQPGCLHANMDVYKWASKLGPLIPGELLLDTFDLARRIRVVDMRASPYDVRVLGLDPIPVETPEGRHDYAQLQQGFATEAQKLRTRVLGAIERARAVAG